MSNLLLSWRLHLFSKVPLANIYIFDNNNIILQQQQKKMKMINQIYCLALSLSRTSQISSSDQNGAPSSTLPTLWPFNSGFLALNSNRKFVERNYPHQCCWRGGGGVVGHAEGGKLKNFGAPDTLNINTHLTSSTTRIYSWEDSHTPTRQMPLTTHSQFNQKALPSGRPP